MRLLVAILCVIAYSASAQDFNPPTIPEPKFPDRSCSVRDFGAVGDGATNDSSAISKAIEHISSAGGGTVKFPAGHYIVASVRLRSNVQLVLETEAVISGAKDGYESPEPNPFADFQDFGHSHFRNAMFYGENVENVAVLGGTINGGVISGSGIVYSGSVPKGGGDKIFAIRSGKNLVFRKITHVTGGHFVYLLNDCENVNLNEIRIRKSRDGVNFVNCRNVAMSGCRFTGCSNDTLAFKSDYALGRKIKSENLYTWNNYFETSCNGVQFGSETAGDFKNVNVWNTRIGRAGKAGIGITSNDGGVIEDVHFGTMTIRGAANPIFMVITKRLRTGASNPSPGAIRNVTIRNVTVKECMPNGSDPVRASTISGLPQTPIENLTIENLTITYPGGEPREEAGVWPPYPKRHRPEDMGVRPASGFFVRHVKGLTFRNVEMAFQSRNVKPPLVFLDVRDLTMDRFAFPKAAEAEAIRLEQIENFRMLGCPGFSDEQRERIEKEKR